MPLTPFVFCAVKAVMTEAPYTPNAANVLRSAWMPAPPEESEPAMVSAIGVVIKSLVKMRCSGPCLVLGGSPNAPAHRRQAGLPSPAVFGLLGPTFLETTAMVPFFVQFKCKLGQSYAVANALAEAEIASEIYSTAGDYDLLVKFYVDNATDIGHFVNEKVQVIPGIQDTHTIITFKAFGTG